MRLIFAPFTVPASLHWRDPALIRNLQVLRRRATVSQHTSGGCGARCRLRTADAKVRGLGGLIKAIIFYSTSSKHVPGTAGRRCCRRGTGTRPGGGWCGGGGRGSHRQPEERCRIASSKITPPHWLGTNRRRFFFQAGSYDHFCACSIPTHISPLNTGYGGTAALNYRHITPWEHPGGLFAHTRPFTHIWVDATGNQQNWNCLDFTLFPTGTRVSQVAVRHMWALPRFFFEICYPTGSPGHG